MVIAGRRSAAARPTRERRAEAPRDARSRGCGGGRHHSGTLVRTTRHMTQQTRPNGTLRHLLTLEGMTKPQIESLLTRAQKFVKAPGKAPSHKRSLEGITVANMFTEPSTRTRVS